jgi:hypothetical protein
MTNKALSEMSLGELSIELREAEQQVMAAEYQDGLGAWQSAADTARTRKNAVAQEIDRRLAGLRVDGGVAEVVANGE